MDNKEKQKEEGTLTTPSKSFFTSLPQLPCILQANDHTGVMVNKNNLYKDEYVEPCFHKDMIKTDKLIFNYYGNWDIHVYIIPSKYFINRQEFDNLIISEESRKGMKAGESFKIISIKDAFSQLSVTTKVNLEYFFRAENKQEYQKLIGADYDYDYYKWCWNEMKKVKPKKLGSEKSSPSEQCSNLKNQIKKIKPILLFKLIKEIFGENDVSNKDENIYNLIDFRLLCFNGNSRYASACNGDKFVGFVYTAHGRI